MNNTLKVRLIQCRERQPLAQVENLPGLYADLRPAQMRALANALLSAARECEAAPMGRQTYREQRREYLLAPCTCANRPKPQTGVAQ